MGVLYKDFGAVWQADLVKFCQSVVQATNSPIFLVEVWNISYVPLPR